MMLRSFSTTIFFLTLFVCGACSADKKIISGEKSISPIEFGLLDCKTDVERYKVLLATHTAAIEKGMNVDYSGIKTINIEVPDVKSSIPLSASTNFNGCTINVRNTAGEAVLFSRVSNFQNVTVTKEMVDTGDYTSVSALRQGLFLLILSDETPWVEERIGYNYPVFRKDIVVVKNGSAQNSTIMPYNSRQTRLTSCYLPVRDSIVTISNVTINRSKESTKTTFCFKLRGVYNAQMTNVTVNTPEGSGLWADGVIKIADCAKVHLDKVKVNGTYSLNDHYGYGFDLDNVYDFNLSNSYGHGAWGVFGTRNINELKVHNCDLNRVDIHIYGRNVLIADCKLSERYNQFSGTYGDIVMERCRFTNFTPLINGTSYNAYTPYNLYVKDCVWDVTPGKCTFLNVGLLNDQTNSREELSKKTWPNVYIDGLIVNIPTGLKEIILFSVGSKISYPHSVGFLSDIVIKGLKFKYEHSNSEAASFVISNQPVRFEGPVTCSLNEVSLLNGEKKNIVQAKKKYSYPGSVTYNIHSEQRESFTVSNSFLGYNVNSAYEYDLLYDNCTLAYVRCTPFDLKVYDHCRRTYKNCRIFLNNVDSKKYYIDNLASYEGCEFIPCSDLDIDFYGKYIDVHFKSCIHRKKGRGRLGKTVVIERFADGYFNGKEWTSK